MNDDVSADDPSPAGASSYVCAPNTTPSRSARELRGSPAANRSLKPPQQRPSPLFDPTKNQQGSDSEATATSARNRLSTSNPGEAEAKAQPCTSRIYPKGHPKGAILEGCVHLSFSPGSDSFLLPSPPVAKRLHLPRLAAPRARRSAPDNASTSTRTAKTVAAATATAAVRKSAMARDNAL